MWNNTFDNNMKSCIKNTTWKPHNYSSTYLVFYCVKDGQAMVLMVIRSYFYWSNNKVEVDKNDKRW